MKITKTSILSGKTRTLDIPVTKSQMDNWMKGILIQCAMPDISDDDREFILNGITPEEWDEYLGEEE